jgi:hypothetical protein
VSDLQQYLTWAARGHRSGEWRAREAGTSHDHSSDRAPAHDAGAPGPDRNTDPPQGRYDQDLHRIGACPQTGAAQANAPSSIPMPLEHILSDAGFKPILGIVRSVGRRCPRGDRNVQAPLNARINGAHPRRGTHLTKPLNGILGCAPPSPTRAQLVAVKPTSSHGSCHPGPMRGSGPPESLDRITDVSVTSQNGALGHLVHHGWAVAVTPPLPVPDGSRGRSRPRARSRRSGWRRPACGRRRSPAS